MHKPGEEKRMPVIIAEHDYKGWLEATPQTAATWMQAWPASQLLGQAAPRALPSSRSLRAAEDPSPVIGQNLSLF
jgi:putative SOS response-associated peptidase YedK